MNFSAIFSRKFWLASLVCVCFSLFFVGVLSVSTASAAIDPANVVGLWLFDEGKGNVATDASENGLDGEFEGKPKWVNGKFGKGLELDGAGAHVVIPTHENPRGAITVSIWVKSHTDAWNQHGWTVCKFPNVENCYVGGPGSPYIGVSIANSVWGIACGVGVCLHAR